MEQCPHKSPSPCNTCHTCVIIQMYVLICHKNAHTHTHGQTHTHTHTVLFFSPSRSLSGVCVCVCVCVQVQHVDYSGEGVTVKSSCGSRWSAQKVPHTLTHTHWWLCHVVTPVSVLSDGCCVSQVLVTVPLALLQKNLIGFSPPLPDRKLKAIHSLGAGVIEKVSKCPCQCLLMSLARWSTHRSTLCFRWRSSSPHASGTVKSRERIISATSRPVRRREACSVFSTTWVRRCAAAFCTLAELRLTLRKMLIKFSITCDVLLMSLAQHGSTFVAINLHTARRIQVFTPHS